MAEHPELLEPHSESEMSSRSKCLRAVAKIIARELINSMRPGKNNNSTNGATTADLRDGFTNDEDLS